MARRAFDAGGLPAEECYRFAWEMATSVDPDRRDGTSARRIARDLVDRGENEPERVARYLQCLAAAEAEAGNFEEALTTLELVNPDSRQTRWRELKSQFENDEPYRDNQTGVDL